MTKTTRVDFSCRGVQAVRSFGPACPVEKALSSCATTPPNPKRTAPRHTNTPRVRKRFAHHGHPDFQGSEVDIWIGRVKMKAGGNEPVLQHQCRLDPSGHPCRG